MRLVIALDVALHLIEARTVLPGHHQLLAPTLLRSQVLSALYQAAARGEITKAEASARMDFLRKLKPRLLGDRVLQAHAWAIAERLGWEDTLVAEYLALTRLQADGLVTLDDALAQAIAAEVAVVSLDTLLGR